MISERQQEGTYKVVGVSLQNPSVQRVAAQLRALGASGEVVELSEAAPTAADAARQLGCSIGAIANSLVFNAKDKPILVMTSGAHRVDLGQLGALLEVRPVTRAEPDFVREHTGMSIGGVAPVGHPKPMRTLVDVDLARHAQVWVAAGHPQSAFPTTYDELLRITGGNAAEVG